MIKITKINEKEIMINCNLIELVEETPDTIITLTTGRKIIVLESADEVMEKVVEYNKKLSNKNS